MTGRRWRPAYIALGSNLDQPERHLHQAVLDLHAIADLRVLRASSIVRSAPLDGSEQPDYLNAVVGALTALDGPALLDHCHAIERRHGRDRDQPAWSARPLDLDIIALGLVTSADASLQLPHPGVSARAFVLQPLVQIAPDAHLPTLGRVATLAAQSSHWPLATVGALAVPSATD